MITKIIALWAVGLIISAMFAIVFYCFIKEAMNAANANAYTDHYLDCECGELPEKKLQVKEPALPTNRPCFDDWKKRFNKYLPKN